eukprot:g1259.t1
MPTIHVCYFCSGPVYPGHGQMFVRNDSKIFRFCRGKCKKNFHMKRNPRKLKWTKAYRKAAGKEMKVDSTFDFEKKRNRPVKYDRELMGTTLRAMKRVGQIQRAREERFFKARMAGKKSREKAQNKLEIAQHIDLVAPAAARTKAQLAVLEKAKTAVKANQDAKEAAKKAGTKV